MFIMIFPFLPGSDSDIFKGVSVFVGLLISIGSSSAISNAVAGLVITYMRPFRIGDKIKIDEIIGTVMEKSALVTRIRTIKNEDITIPNSKILTSHTVNYSDPARETGLIIHTTLTIGYDAPWRTVHRLLLEAATGTKGVLKDPAPFVLQTSLDDFYISYQINAYIRDADKMLHIKSELHQNILDSFNRGGVEIMSPHYRAERDGNEVTIPKNRETDSQLNGNN
jgi:small-conductance mechanosensitive channel